MNMNFKRKLPIPKDIKEQFPLNEKSEKIKAERDAEIKDVFTGKSNKFLLIIGPCSAESKEPVMEYLSRLKKVSDRVKDKIIMIPRIYTNKPRTTGAGYKGMLHQPNPNKSPDMLEGIIAIRDLHLSALRDFGFSSADEMLYPDNHRYLSDLLSYVAVGARSVENQQHRLTASGLDVPVGLKNPTSGDYAPMMNAISAAQHSHTFIYRGWEVQSTGNSFSHAILRGYTDFSGRHISNYHYENLLEIDNLYKQKNLLNPAVIVDTNHENSGKKYLEQIRIAKDVLYSRNHNSDIKNLVKGLMIESYLADGSGSIENHEFGQSITDPCLGWEKTEKLILTIADNL